MTVFFDSLHEYRFHANRDSMPLRKISQRS